MGAMKALETKKAAGRLAGGLLAFQLEVDATSKLQLAWVVGLSCDLAIGSK